MRSPRTWLFHVDVDIQDSGASLSHGPECTVRRFFLCFVCVCVCARARARVSFFVYGLNARVNICVPSG